MCSQKKLEIRNSKQIQMIKKQSKQARFGFRFLDFGFEVLRFVSDFELRISDFDSKRE